METAAVNGTEGQVTAPAHTRILLVEDDAQIARSFERLIRRELGSCDVAAVTSAEIAIILLYTQDFDLVVSDYDLAGKRTGADVLAAVRADLNRPAFLFVSGNEAVESLGVPWLAKPCEPAALREAIRRLVRKDSHAAIQQHGAL